jgi:DNA-binding MarR family transcriptional regulator
MKADTIKRMLDACYEAKRIREQLPELPEGVKPVYIQYIDKIHGLQQEQDHVKVSDISDILKLPRPGVTRTVKEMVEKGYLQKYASEEDGRITYIRITRKVRNCLRNTTKIITIVWQNTWIILRKKRLQ